MRTGVFQTETKRSRAALWSARLALFGAALILVGIALHRLFNLATPTFLDIIAVGFGLAALAILLALVGFVAIWSTGIRGTGAAAAGALIGAAILAWPASYLPTVITQAPLNDVSTDTDDPPLFDKVTAARPVGANATAYPGRAASGVQTALYPDIRPVVVERPAAETFELVVQALTRAGLEIVDEREPTRTTPGVAEATGRTLVIGFRDDVVVRVIGRGNRSKIDVRSASRWGRYDFGRNAERVRTLVRGILERLQSTVPASQSR
ncbi:MAG: DUF1499 domain-containing protein [Pseudomonadota bacterium]